MDGDYHRAMYEMFLKGRGESIVPSGTTSAGVGVGPQGKEGLSIVGWYATGSSEGGQAGLGTFSALIQNFYEQETAPFPAVHVALDTGTEKGVGAGVRAYVRSVVLPSSILHSPTWYGTALQWEYIQNQKIAYSHPFPAN